MRLTLQNFRCYKSAVINLPTNSVVLISGESGCGKTTIFKAINFALFGKEQKVATHGQKKVKVQLEFENLFIERSKNPNHLILKIDGQKYIDDAAQGIINEKFGQDFLLTSYIAQKSIEGFFSLSDAEKTSFLHRISIQNFDIESLKSNVKNIVKERKNKLLQVSAEALSYSKLLKEEGLTEEPIEPKLKLKFPSKDKSLEDQLSEEKEAKKANEKKLLEMKQTLQALNKQNEMYHKSLSNTTKIQVELDSKKVIKKELEEIIEREKEIVNLISAKQKEIDEIEDILENITKAKKLSELQTNYNSLVENFSDSKLRREEEIKKQLSQIKEVDINQLQSKIKNIERRDEFFSKIEDFLQEGEDLPESISEAVKFLENCKEDLNSQLTDINIGEIKSILENKNSEISIKKEKLNFLRSQLSGTKLSCPECKSHLILDSQILIKYDEDKLKSEVTSEEKNMVTLEKTIQKLNKKYESSQSEVSEIKDDLNFLEKCLNQSQTIVDEDDDLDDLKNKINEAQQQQGRKKLLLTSLKAVEEEKFPQSVQQIEKQIKILKNELQDFQLKDNLENEINQKNKKCNERLVQLKMDKTQIDQAKQNLKVINKEIINLEYELEEFSDSKNCQAEIEEINEQIKIREEKFSKFLEREKQIMEFNANFSEWTRNSKIWKKCMEARESEKLWTRAFGAAEQLSLDIQKAEHEALESILSSLNKEIEEFMSEFFEDGLSMIITPDKTLASGDKKANIGIKIKRNGEDIPMDTLSGGEYDRCALSFFLAINTVLSNNNLILLDESLTSLHSNAVEEIVDIIRNKMKNKTVFVTLHQVVSGMFDHEIDVSKLVCERA